MVDFAGWEMPVQYTGILQEHSTVRTACGVFDISHMGEFFVSGAGCVPWLDGLLTNKVAALEIGRAQYSLMLNEQGGVIDDLIVYRMGEESFLIIVNAAKIDEDEAWMRKHLAPGVEFSNKSDDYAALAVQGPKSGAVYEALFGQPLPEQRNRIVVHGDIYAVITGYTGEIGFEIVVPAAKAAEYWDKVLAAGAVPAGLGARDTLRLEMCYPLNGSDLSPEHTPLEAGLGFFVDVLKGDFIGRERLLEQKSKGLTQRLSAIEVIGKCPPIRSHYNVLAFGKKVAETTSGALSPSLQKGIALAYLPIELAKIGQELEIEVRGKAYSAVVVKKPFYQPKP
ncbi:MAG: glycine cleavage system protein T [Verrucomicrobia bacterium 61-8]|nr:MAG: glycine cleavage system protein T [Verrucomicrobia bacterium 61-8]